MKICGLIDNDVVYCSEMTTQQFRALPADPADYYTKYGWFFPSPSVDTIVGFMDGRREGILVYAFATLIRPDGKVYDILNSGPGFLNAVEHNKTKLKVIALDDDTQRQCDAYEYLSTSSSSHYLDKPVTAKKILKLHHSHQMGYRITRYSTVSEIVKELHRRGFTETVPLVNSIV